MENFEATANEHEMPQQQSLPLENNSQLAENTLLTNDNIDALEITDTTSSSEIQTIVETQTIAETQPIVETKLIVETQPIVETVDVSSTNTNVASETNSVVSSDNTMPPLPPLPNDDKGQLPQPPAAYSADYNMQNYANYNYMYNYNNYYGYPYPQYQWDYNSQQYYQPYQNYYNYNYNQANQAQTSKPPPPPDAVQLPVEEKPANKSNTTTVDDSNRYSPTVETDDDDTMKGSSENSKTDVHNEQLLSQTTKSFKNTVSIQNVLSEPTEFQKHMPESESVDQKMIQPIFSSVTSDQQPIVPLIAQIQQYNMPIQQPSYSNNPQIQIQPTEANNESMNLQHNSHALNGKDESAEKVSKGSTVLGKTQAKKRLMAFSMMKQKLQEQNNLNNDNPNLDVGEGNDVEFVPELNVFQTVPKKKVVTNKKVIKVIKAQQTIEQIEEMKKDELLQGNNAALYQHLLRSGGNEAPILQKLGIESLAEKYSAKIREQDKRMKRHHHRRRDDNRRSHKYRRRSHSKSRSRSRSAEKPKMRALEVKSWKDFVNGGFHFDRFRRFKLDEAEELKEKERKSRSKKRHSDSRSDGKNQNIDSGILTEAEKGNGDQKLRYNILDHKKEIRKGLEVLTHEADFTKDFPSYIIQYTKTKPVIKYSENPATATCHLQNRQQMLATLLPEIEIIVHKFLSEMKPKKLKENTTDDSYIFVDDKLLVMMKDKNIYPFKGWWPKICFIVTQVKENPNIEIDKDALINQFTISKRTKKSRFNDGSSLVDIRPTVPSKWDSDYDGSPATEKVVDIEVSQNVVVNTNDDVRLSQITNIDETNLQDISHQEEAMDTASDIGENEPKIEINVGPILPIPSHEPQGHAKLDTEYEEFLKIVSAENNDERIENDLMTSSVEKEDDNNQSVKSVSLNNESVEISQDDDFEDSSSSDESVSVHNIVDESMDTTFVKKLKKKKKSSNKKSKKYKKKEGKQKKHKSSSSESSQVSESESDSSSDESESESTDSTSSIEKKKKKKSKDKKKKKNKINYKKKHKGDKLKIKNPDEGNSNNSSILNLLEKAFNVEIKKRPLDHEEPKQKKKKRKHDKKEYKSNGENEDQFEKVKECLKETFTKLVTTDIVGKNQSLSCDDNTVNEVLKYFKMDDEKEKKNKKSKKKSKRKYNSDISDDEKITKKFRLDDGSKHSDNEKKKKNKKKKYSKNFNDSDEQLIKKKSKKKSKTSDTSETEDGNESKHNKSKNEKGTEHFFGLRPNEWNINNQSSMRGVVHHSDVKNTPPKGSEFYEIIKLDKSTSLQLSNENLTILSSQNNISEIPSIHEEYDEQSNKQLEISDKNINSSITDYVSTNIVGGKIKIDFINSDNEKSKEEEYNIENDEMSDKSEQCNKNFLEHDNNLPTTILLTNDNYKQQELNKDHINILKPTQSKPLEQKNDAPVFNTLIKPFGKTISYRDKVKMNLKKLSTCQHIPFVFGFSSPLNVIKSNNLKIEKIKESFDVLKDEVKPKLDESKLLKEDRPKVVICPQTQKKSNVANIIPPKIDMVTDNKVLDRSFSWEDSEESDSNQSTATSEHLSDIAESDQIVSGLMEDDTLNKYNENQPYANEIFSNYGKIKDHHLQLHTSGITKSNISSGSENKKQEQITKVDNIVAKETTLWNLDDLSKYQQHFESYANAMELKNGGTLVTIVSHVEKDSDSICSQNSMIAEKVSKTDNELITQWKSDWNELNKSVIEINKSANLDNTMNLKFKKKSRWDEHPNEKIDSLLSFHEEESMDKTSNYTNDGPKSTSSMSNDFSEEQNQTYETLSIKSENEGTEFNNCSESLCKDNYDNYSQSYEQYSCIPLYSDMKSIETSELSPVDYSLYENYNPNYEYCDEDYEMWKSMDSSQQMTSIPTTSDTLPASLQLGNVSEISQSDIIFNEQAEFSNNEMEFSIDQAINNNIVTIIPDVQDGVAENEKSVSTIRDEKFVQLYQQYFQHYNQNPVKYSVSDPVLDSITEVDFSAPEKLSKEELPDTDQTINKSISLPLQERSYARITKDLNTSVYLTSDNYIAYCAVEDKCMVHIAVDSTNRDGVEDKVRHCFNIYQNGTIIEYWLHADLIPFHVPSDAESGVFSDDEVDSLGSDSDQEEHVTINDDNEDNDNVNKDHDNVNKDDDNVNKDDDYDYKYDDNVNKDDDDDDDNFENADMIVGEWELVDSDSESDVDSWLGNPSIINKYGENCFYDDDQKLPDPTKDEYVSNSDYDSDISENSDSNIQSYLDVKPNITIDQLQNFSKEDENKSSNIIDEITNNDLEQAENTANNVDNDSNFELSDQLQSDVGSEKKIALLEDSKNSTSDKILIRNHDSVLLKLEEKDYIKKESEIPVKEEVATEDVFMVDTIINQQLLIQRLKIRTKEKIQEKLPDTVMVRYSDNTETIKYPFLGLFQPPTNSILSKRPSKKSNLSKRVIFADGILPGEDLAASPTHDDVGRPLSPPPLRALMREIMKFKRNMYPFKRSKVRTKLTMVNKKVATVTPSIKATTSSVIEYYISRRRLEDLPIPETTVFRSDDSPISDNDDHTSEKMSTPPRPTRESTPVPSDNECWDDDDNIKDDR